MGDNISLIGCLYKVLAKMLANSLKWVMDDVISTTQSTFISGRKMLDGVLIAIELVHEANGKKNKLLCFKLDFEKAYDSVSWEFLDFMIQGIGFSAFGGGGSRNAFQ